MNRPPAIDRLRRSAHFVPGANEKMLMKSIESAADCLILDLEDAVTPDRKDDAREIVEGLAEEYAACESPDYIKWASGKENERMPGEGLVNPRRAAADY